MSYLEIKFSPIIDENDHSLLIAELLECGFDSFNEEENATLAYISADTFDKSLLDRLTFLKNHPEVKIEINTLEDINWNREWESNYQPVTIAGKCHVRAPFHPPVERVLYEIIIEPKMAFGTAHHETTQLMAEWLMELDVAGKTVLDMGCGTGILAILANKLGAHCVTGIDNDEWAWRNAQENFRINGLSSEDARFGDASLIEENKYEIILANINRNVLLHDMKIYANGLRKDGKMLLSGFYRNDIEAIKYSTMESGLYFSGSGFLNDWAVVLLQKQNR